MSPAAVEGAVPKGNDEPDRRIEIELQDYVVRAIAVYAQFKEFVRDMEANARTDWDDTPLRRMADAQSAAIKYLQAALLLSQPRAKVAALIKPLEDVRIALSEIALGRNPEVVFQTLRPEGVVTKQRDTLVHQAQSLLVLAWAALLRRPGGSMKPKEAKVRLDDELKARGLYDKVHAEHIQGWHNQLNSGKGRAAPQLVKGFRHFRPELVELRTREQAEALMAKCLDAVRDMGLPRLTLRLVGAHRKSLTTLPFSKRNAE
jgi:hypothetical protein